MKRTASTSTHDTQAILTLCDVEHIANAIDTGVGPDEQILLEASRQLKYDPRASAATDELCRTLGVRTERVRVCGWLDATGAQQPQEPPYTVHDAHLIGGSQGETVLDLERGTAPSREAHHNDAGFRVSVEHSRLDLLRGRGQVAAPP